MNNKPKGFKLFEVDEKASKTSKTAYRRKFLKLGITVIQAYHKVKGKYTLFYNDEYREIFQLKGYYNVTQCEEIFLLRYYAYEQGKKDGNNEMRMKFRNLLEIEE